MSNNNLDNNNKEKKERKYNSGQFVKGNTIGMETRFSAGHHLSSKYRDEYCDMIVEYYRACVRQDPPRVPTLEGFADSIDILAGTCREWAEKYPQFNEALERARQIQKDTLINNGANRAYDGNIVKFLLSNFHGMRDKQEVASEVKAEVSAQIDERTLKMIERVNARLHDNNNGN
jgi:hypothetical protein